MVSCIIADIIVVIHSVFILFVMTGGFLVLRWRRLILLHVPAALWGALIEFQGWFCPLTYLEKHFRKGGGYHGGFIEHYILPLVYPPELTRQLQIFFGSAVLAVNCAVYAWLLARHFRKKHLNATR